VKVLLADDEPTLRTTLADALGEAGHEVVPVADGAAALAALAAGTYDCVVTDLRMPGADGLEVLRAARAAGAEAVVLTGAGSVETAVAAMKAGAWDYLQKPFPEAELVLLLDRIGEKRALAAEVVELRASLAGRRGLGRLIGDGPAIRLVRERAAAAAAVEATLLVTGESGTGKEVLARAVHEEGRRAAGPFIPLSCAALAETLLEDELFGHEKGAFTDARAARPGRFELADGGTLLLDDIDDLPLRMQVKLLRVLQEREVERLGGTAPVRVDVRVIAASKKDLAAEVRAGRFRSDLFYRLDVLRIDLPPLRERREDVPGLLLHFVAKHAGGSPARIAPETLSALVRRSWAGNVRELENAVLRALALRDGGELRLEHFGAAEAPAGTVEVVEPLAEAVHRCEREAIRAALAACAGNRTRAAERLGISRKNLWEKMKALFGEAGAEAPE